MNEVTTDEADAVHVESVLGEDDMFLGKIVKRKGLFFFIPTYDYHLVLGATTAMRIANRLMELTRANNERTN